MEQPLYPNLILDALRHVRYPGTGRDIVDSGMVADDMRIDGRRVSFTLQFTRRADPFMKSLVKAAEAAIHTYVGPDVEVTVDTAVPAPPPQAPDPLPGVSNIIGVSSGKGGVGKSTVAVNLAVALAREGYRVGLLDADIFGPSVPKMLGVEDEPVYQADVDGRPMIVPLERYGVELFSIGLLVDKDSATVWRGGMASNALKQLITEVAWGSLDYFIIDMPPGTSDIHLTLVQTLAITGVVIVTTPQEVALADARKGISMFTGDKVGVPVLGIVENMAWFTPPAHPDERYYIFGRDGGAELARKLGVKLLAQIPVVESIRQGADEGRPAALGDTATAQAYLHLAREVADATERRNATAPATIPVKLNTH